MPKGTKIALESETERVVDSQPIGDELADEMDVEVVNTEDDEIEAIVEPTMEEEPEEAEEAAAPKRTRTRTRKRTRAAQHTGRENTLPDELKKEGMVGINAASRKERRELYKEDKVWSIDPDAPAETEATELQETYIDLVSSYQTGKILTGTIASTGLIGESGTPCVFVNYNEYTVIIPADHLYVNATTNKNGEKLELQSVTYYLDQRVGSDVSFIVLTVFEAEKEAYASAVKATEALVNRYFLDTDSRGRHRINVGDIVEGQITFVMPRGIGISVQGVETYVTRQELSYLHVSNPTTEVDARGRQKYYVGKKINVKVKNIAPVKYKIHHSYKNESGSLQKDSVFQLVDLDVSVKEASKNPMAETFGKPGYRIGDKTMGRILDRTDKGYFVRINEQRDILCDDDVDRLPPGTLVKVKIRRINPKDYNIYGKIINVIRMPR